MQQGIISFCQSSVYKMRFSVDLKIAHLRKQQQFYHLLAAGKVVRPPGREWPFLDRLEQGVGDQKNSKAPVPLPRYATQLPGINRRFQGPGKDETCCSPLLFSNLQNKHHVRWWPQGPSIDNSPCRVDLHCHPLWSLISQQAPLPTETCDVQDSFPAYYVKLASEAHRHWEYCTVGDLDCLTCSIGKLFFFLFLEWVFKHGTIFCKTDQRIYQDNCDLHYHFAKRAYLQHAYTFCFDSTKPIWSSMILM